MAQLTIYGDKSDITALVRFLYSIGWKLSDLESNINEDALIYDSAEQLVSQRFENVDSTFGFRDQYFMAGNENMGSSYIKKRIEIDHPKYSKGSFKYRIGVSGGYQFYIGKIKEDLVTATKLVGLTEKELLDVNQRIDVKGYLDLQKQVKRFLTKQLAAEKQYNSYFCQSAIENRTPKTKFSYLEGYYGYYQKSEEGEWIMTTVREV